MKFAKNFMRVAMMAFAVVAMGACTPSDPVEGGDENKPAAVTFTVQAEAGETTATISISHNGTAENTWYGFLTDKVDEAALSLVYAMVGEVDAEDLQTGTTATVNLTDLELATSYKYVVFGVTADGAIYGTPGEATFTTEDGRSMSVNEAWTIEYVGDYTNESNNTVYPNCVSVTSTDENTYYVDCFTAEGWADVQTDMYAYVEGLIAQMKAELPMLNQYYGTNMTFEEAYLYSGDGMATLGDLDPGKYIAVAWGITADQKVSRLYATSAEFEVVEQEATPEYSAWLGNWTAAGEGVTYIPNENPEMDGTYEEGAISFDFTLEKNINNKSYVMDGWTGVTGVPFLVDYDAANDILVITTDVIAEGVDFGDYGTGTIYLLAEVLEGGKSKIYYGLDVLMGTTSAGERIIVGGDYSNYGLELYSMGLYYSLDADTGTEYEGYVYAMSDITPYFPLTLTPAVAAPAEVSAKASAMDRSINRAEGKYLNTWNNYEVGKSKFNSIKF